MSIMYTANGWKVAFRRDPHKVKVIASTARKPFWADEVWQPPHVAMTEDIACRAVLRVLVSEGFPPEMVDAALGERVQSWADNPQRMIWAGGKNKLLDSYNGLRQHLSQGGRLRDVPAEIVERVGEAFGLETFQHVIMLEHQTEGPWPQPYKDLIADLWTITPADQLPRPGQIH